MSRNLDVELFKQVDRLAGHLVTTLKNINLLEKRISKLEQELGQLKKEWWND